MRFLGYLDATLDHEAIDSEGYVLTGDLGVVDQKGQLWVTGRKKDIIIRKGENISAREVEDVLVSHPRIREVAVVGLPDPERGERCCAFVVPTTPGDPLDVADLLEHCQAAGLMTLKTPEQVENLAELPVNPTGKVMKALLRERFANKRDERVTSNC
jgi:acyl-CoA synthetase (AMP-forming)/AMP-acid ligase II